MKIAGSIMKTQNQARQTKNNNCRQASNKLDRGTPIVPVANSSNSKPKTAYSRATDLPRLLPLWTSDVTAHEKIDHSELLNELRAALRAERRRGINAHWTYDLARHANLLVAYREELGRYEMDRNDTIIENDYV